MNELVHLRQLAAKFRDAIERTDRSNLIVTLAQFPLGACGDAALLLGVFLKAKGLGPSVYVLGHRDNWSHAWIELSGVTIDITADQFPEVDERVIVTTDPRWHETFEQSRPHEADYNVYDPHTVFELDKAYKAVIANL